MPLGQCVTIQLGQCGNQLGAVLLDRLAVEAGSESEAHYFFREGADATTRRARAVLVDTEPRAVGAARGGSTRGRRWAYDDANRVLADGGLRGCANNWARGFHAPAEEVARAADAVRREMERCDAVDALIALGSGGGGTGSGLGCALATALADGTPKTRCLHGVVLPDFQGDVAVGSCNAMLTLAHLCGDAVCGGGVVLLSNDAGRRLAVGALKQARPSLDTLNRVFATQLLGALLPARDGERRRAGLAATADHLFADPSYRLATAAAAPLYAAAGNAAFDENSWQAVLRELRRRALAPPPPPLSLANPGTPRHRPPAPAPQRPCGCLAASIALRGADAKAGADAVARNFPADLFAAWGPSVPLRVVSASHRLAAAPRTASVLANSSACLPFVEHVCNRVRPMLDAGAYVHHYAKHGMGLEELEARLATLGRVVADYQALDGRPDGPPPPSFEPRGRVVADYPALDGRPDGPPPPPPPAPLGGCQFYDDAGFCDDAPPPPPPPSDALADLRVDDAGPGRPSRQLL